jgi:hypothetical protein
LNNERSLGFAGALRALLYRLNANEKSEKGNKYRATAVDFELPYCGRKPNVNSSL